MKKKLLFTLLLFVITITFSQQKSINKLSVVPNPFTYSTKISFSTSINSPVFFTVKNILGKTVFTKTIQAVKGKNTVPFFKRNLSKGIYIYTLQSKNYITSKRFVIQ
jgi:hypothetical protein